MDYYFINVACCNQNSLIIVQKTYQFSIICIIKMQPGKNPQSNQKPKVTFSYQNKNLVQNAIPLNQVQQVPMPMQMQMPVQNQIQDYAWQSDQILQVSSNNMMNNNIELQQFQVPSYGGYCGVVQGGMNQNICYPGNSGHSGVSIELLSADKQDKDKKVVAVIVSFVSNFSYDNLFTTVQQKSQEGTKVLVYSCTSQAVQPIFKAYKGEETDNEKAKELIKNIRQVDPDCVVFNWECSAGYGSQTFPEGKEALFSFLKFVIDKGHMAMFSDFSLKSLIQQWDATKLGPNPFKKVGQTSSPFELSFQRQKLMQCPSAQLQIVGQMSQNGRCHVQAMGGTIVYSVNNKIKKTDFYQLSVLTIAETDCQYQQNDYKLELKQKKGSAGHVLLTYKSGGHLLTSMGHWIELMKVDTSEHKLFEIAEKQFGSSYAQQMKYQYAQMDGMQQKQFVSQNAVRFVQNQAPCQNMMSKNAYISKKG